MIPLVDLKANYLFIKDEIDVAIREVIDNTSFIMGEPVKKFESELANYCNCDHAFGVSSGSSALFLALKAYGIGPGDEVITVPNSFIATPESIIQCGAKPVFVDVNEDDMLIDVTKIEQVITDKTKAIIPVHLYGQICDMDPIIEIAKKHNLVILEDAAQAIGAEYKGRKLPIHETATFSFFPAKNLGCFGDGGAVVTNNSNVAKIVSKLRDHGRISKYESDVIGYGERLDAIQAAILSVKLKHLDDCTDDRIKNAKIYDLKLREIGINFPVKREYSKHVYYMYEIFVANRDGLMKYLLENNVSTGIHYPVPLHLQKSLLYLGYKKTSFPVAELCAKRILSIPMYPELEESSIEEICKLIGMWKKIESR